jgi:hypothetical protein
VSIGLTLVSKINLLLGQPARRSRVIGRCVGHLPNMHSDGIPYLSSVTLVNEAEQKIPTLVITPCCITFIKLFAWKGPTLHVN